MAEEIELPADKPSGAPAPEPMEKSRSASRSPVAMVSSAFSPGGWGRRFAKLWGFLGFALLVVFLARHVMMPFVFAILLGYILAPVVRSLSCRKDGSQRLPKGISIVVCYIVLLAALALFMGTLLPRISSDIARVGSEAPTLYKKLNDVWAPEVANWMVVNFPTVNQQHLAAAASPRDAAGVPPGTQMVVTPLPDGRLAIRLNPTGLEVKSHNGAWQITPSAQVAEEPTLEDKLRGVLRDGLTGLQTQLGNVFRLGQAVLRAVIRSVFTFFLVLMITAFLLLDLDRIHDFARGLIPAAYHQDYEIIVGGIDRGMNGVIRGQLLICLVNGVLTWLGLMIFGVRYALLLATVAAVLSLIPIFGSILSTIPIVLSALVSGDAGIELVRGLAVLGWIIGIHLFEANFLNPRIMGSAARIHPVMVIFALVLGEHAYGLTGALLAVPVASIVQVLFGFFRSKAWKVEMGGAA